MRMSTYERKRKLRDSYRERKKCYFFNEGQNESLKNCWGYERSFWNCRKKSQILSYSNWLQKWAYFL